MKIKITSDNHIDRLNSIGLDTFIKSNKNTENVDVLIVAGDWCNGFKHDMFSVLVSIASEYKHCLYIPGNHDYYGEIIGHQPDLLNWLDINFPDHNITVLDNKIANIEGQRFAGSTLWSYIPPSLSYLIRERINNYRVIKFVNKKYNTYNRLTPEDTTEFFALNKEFLKQNIQSGDIVITHHLPSFESVNWKYWGSDINCAFASNLESLIMDKQPSIWIHGHTHDSCDYMIESTRVVCNPMGYNFQNEQYNPNFIIEI